MKLRIMAELERAYDSGMRHFICGMAQGCDLYFAQGVLALRACSVGVTLEAARPCDSQANGWPQELKNRYHDILGKCDFETLVQHTYDRGCMLRRNRYMVDRSEMVIAVYDGIPSGGTAQTIAYAMKKGRNMRLLQVYKEDTE